MYSQNPNQDRWTTITRVARYLRGTIDYELNLVDLYQYLNGIVMQIGSPSQMSSNPLVVLFLPLVEVWYHGNHPSRHV